MLPRLRGEIDLCSPALAGVRPRPRLFVARRGRSRAVGAGRGLSRLVVGHYLNDVAARRTSRRLSPYGTEQPELVNGSKRVRAVSRLGAIVRARSPASVPAMTNGQNEAFSRILIDKALEFSGWDLLDPKQVQGRQPPAASVWTICSSQCSTAPLMENCKSDGLQRLRDYEANNLFRKTRPNREG